MDITNNEPKRKKRLFSFQTESDHLVKLEQYAKDRYTSASQVMRALLASHLKAEGYITE